MNKIVEKPFLAAVLFTAILLTVYTVVVKGDVEALDQLWAIFNTLSQQ